MSGIEVLTFLESEWSISPIQEDHEDFSSSLFPFRWSKAVWDLSQQFPIITFTCLLETRGDKFKVMVNFRMFRDDGVMLKITAFEQSFDECLRKIRSDALELPNFDDTAIISELDSIINNYEVYCVHEG